MKLQIAEYKVTNMLDGNIDYRYVLELEEKAVLWTMPTPTKKELKQVCSILMNKLLDDNIDYNMEHYIKIGNFPCMNREVIFEQEVPDTYLKDIKIKHRLVKIQEDF